MECGAMSLLSMCPEDHDADNRPPCRQGTIALS
jgi:hypothetical protein